MEPPKAKKRQLDVAHLQSTPYFKMRSIVKELRPHIIQVLRTPDFRNCKAATEIRQELNVLMDLCKEMAAQTATAPTQSKNGVQGLKPSGVTNQNMKSAEKPPAPSERSASVIKPCDDKGVASSGSLSLKQRTVDAIANGTYIVGGSAFGWNFIVYPGDAMVYYGRTKESFRSSNPKSQ